ncbi:MAG: DNA adenine methylase [Deltaproteobacteria bacterium]|nr:DNA adenine methylase [Nannocystaceae bacterium]
MIKYIGSKRVLVPALVEAIRALPQARSVLDVFSGTARVGHALKAAGLQVTANDHNAYAHALACCYVQADADRHAGSAAQLLAELARIEPRAGWFTATFCERARFIHPDNGARIEAIRERIETLALDPELRAIALVSLMEAADRVDSTTGVQMAYLKQWAPRALGQLELRMPKLLPGRGLACELDALAFARSHGADVAYLDPPYNQHSYLGNYHVWETLVRWDRPEVYGVACKRVDVRERPSPFNRKREIVGALRELLDALDVRHIVVSFSNEGHIARDEMTELLSAHGEVGVREIVHPRYVGARIGIYNPRGQKVGKIGHLENVEYLFTVQRTATRRRAS